MNTETKINLNEDVFYTFKVKESASDSDFKTAYMEDECSKFYVKNEDGSFEPTTMEDIVKDYDVIEMSEDVAAVGYYYYIFPELFAPYVSTDLMALCVSERKDIIASMLDADMADVNKCIGKEAIEARPDLYNESYSDYSDTDSGVCTLYKSIVKTEDGYAFGKIEIYVYDITVGTFTLNENGNSYTLEVDAEREMKGDRQGILNRVCRDTLWGAAILSNVEPLKHITEKEYRLPEGVLDTIKEMPANAVMHLDEYLDNVILTIRKDEHFQKGIIMETVLEDETNDVTVDFELNGKVIAKTEALPVARLEAVLNDIRNGDVSALLDPKKPLPELVNKAKARDTIER